MRELPEPDSYTWGANEPNVFTPGLVKAIQKQAYEDGLRDAGKDAERYRWIAKNVHERPLRPAAYGSDMYPDMRLRYELPVLVSFDAIGQKISFDSATDAAMLTASQKEVP